MSVPPPSPLRWARAHWDRRSSSGSTPPISPMSCKARSLSAASLSCSISASTEWSARRSAGAGLSQSPFSRRDQQRRAQRANQREGGGGQGYDTKALDEGFGEGGFHKSPVLLRQRRQRCAAPAAVD